jgi:hypothetical protein
MRIGVGINLARVGVLGGDFGVGLGPGGLGVQAAAYLGGVAPYHWLDFIANRALYAGADVGNVTGATGYSFTRASQGYYQNADGTLTLFGYNLLVRSEQFDNASWQKFNSASASGTVLTFVNTNSYFQQGVFSSGLVVGDPVTFSLIASVASGSTTMRMGLGDADDGNPLYSNNITLTTTPTRFTWTQVMGAGFGGNLAVQLLGASLIAAGSVVTVSEVQVERGDVRTAYVPTTSAAAGALRRGDRGVLIEGSRTNLLTYSQQFDNAAWTKLGVGTGVAPIVTANAGVAPDDTMTADRVQFNLGGGTTIGDYSWLLQSVTVTNATPYTESVYIKSNTASSYVMELDISGSAARQIINVTPTWQRFSTTFTSTSTSMQARIGLRGAGATQNSDTADVLVWQADLQAGAFPSSPIVTVAASATRAADVLTYTAGVSYPVSLWAEFERAVDTGSFEELFNLDDGDSSDRAVLYVGTTDLASVDMRTASVSQGPATVAGTVALNTVTKLAGRFQTNDMRPARGGTLGTADTSCTLPAAPTRLVIGNAPSFGYIRRIAVIQGAGTDANLQVMTT